MEKRENAGIQLMGQRSYTNELSDLLDFVQDIPEGKLELVTISNSADMEKIKSYARKLEKINADLRDENQKLITESKINERISIIREKDNGDLRRDNIAWQKACNELKLKNGYQDESSKTYEAYRDHLRMLQIIKKNMEGK